MNVKNLLLTIRQKIRVPLPIVMILALIAGAMLDPYATTLLKDAKIWRSMRNDWRYQVIESIEAQSPYIYVLDVQEQITKNGETRIWVWLCYDTKAAIRGLPKDVRFETLIRQAFHTPILVLSAGADRTLEETGPGLFGNHLRSTTIKYRPDRIQITLASVVGVDTFEGEGHKAIEGITISGPTDILASWVERNGAWDDLWALYYAGDVIVSSPNIFYPPRELGKALPRPSWARGFWMGGESKDEEK